MKFALSLTAILCIQGVHSQTYTTNAGSPVDDARNSQTLTRDGPILLQDQFLIERLQVQNRERIPERTVHARGALAKGNFVLTRDMSEFTLAKVFQNTGKKTPIACRFSTVIHGKGSPEFLRDPRGFALKMYTEEGNYDIVGLHFPVFFIRDGIRFPDMIRSLKPNPIRGVQEWWRILDFFSNYPESVHMFTWLLDDVGIPKNYRQLSGFGVHTFKWINKAGKEHWVRYTYLPWQGEANLMDDEAPQQPFSAATVDLFDMIDDNSTRRCTRDESTWGPHCAGWNFYVQILDPSNTTLIRSLNFDPLDTTKMWPRDILPLQEIGHFSFDENPTSQFLDNEQSAFSPARMVPGIEPSDEKMLQTRLFSYGDTQRYRLGVNNQMLPINRPKCAFYDQHIDGMMHFSQEGAAVREVNYFPSMADPRVREAAPFPHDPQSYSGQKVREMIELTNDFQQPGERYRSMDSQRQDRLAMRIASTLTGPRLDPKVKKIWLGYWAKVDSRLVRDIKRNIRNFNNMNRMPSTRRHKFFKFFAAFFRSCGAKA